MSNKIQPGTIRELVKPQDNPLSESISSEVESLCEPYNFTCTGTYTISCTQYSDAGKDLDLLF